MTDPTPTPRPAPSRDAEIARRRAALERVLDAAKVDCAEYALRLNRARNEVTAEQLGLTVRR
jgi:hypothetical protein